MDDEKTTLNELLKAENSLAVKYAVMLYQMIKRGFSAAVYTQTTDVEVEVNGLMTYDRKVIKLDEKRVKEINTRICNSLKK